MKGKLEFTLPEEQSVFDIASKAFDLSSSLWNYKNMIRTKLKHGCEGKSDDYIKAWEEIQAEFLDEFWRYNFDE